jgi:membrane protein
MTQALASVMEYAVARIKAVPGGSLILQIVADLARSEIADRAMTLAGQAFTSILPVMILLSAIPGKGVVDDALDGYDLTSTDLAIGPAGVQDAAVTFGLIGAVMTLVSATSFSRALDRMYSRVWDVPRLTMKQSWRWLVVILAVVIGVVIQIVLPSLRDVWSVGAAVDFGVELMLGFALWAVLWFGIAWLLTSGQVNVRCLLVNAAITAAGLSALVVATHVGLSKVVASATAQFGVLGVIFTVISWLFVFSAIVIAATVIVHAMAVEEGIIGRWLNGAGTPDSIRGRLIPEPSTE